MYYLIINADDFGYSAKVNEAVLRAHQNGVLTSASLMVTEAGSGQAVDIARQTPTLGVGLHVTVTHDHALLTGDAIPLLVDAQGRLGADPFRAAWRYYFNRKAQQQLQCEMEAQFARFASFGLPWSHVDGHQHFHLHPVVWDTLLDLCDQYGVHRVRAPYEELRAHFGQRKTEEKKRRREEEKKKHESGDRRQSSEDTGTFAIENRKPKIENRIEGFSLNTVSMLALRALRQRNLRALQARQTLGGKPAFWCERVYGQLQTGSMHENYLLSLLERVHARTNEIYFHPGSPHARALPPERQRDDVRDMELHALLSPVVRARLEALGLQTGTYAQLEAAIRAEEPVAQAKAFSSQ